MQLLIRIFQIIVITKINNHHNTISTHAYTHALSVIGGAKARWNRAKSNNSICRSHSDCYEERETFNEWSGEQHKEIIITDMVEVEKYQIHFGKPIW